MQKIVEIVKGEDRTLNITLMDEDAETFYDLAGYTALAVKLLKSDGTYLSLTPTVVSEPGGKLQVVISDTNTAMLAEGVQSMSVVVDKSTNKRIITKGFEKALKILPQPF